MSDTAREIAHRVTNNCTGEQHNSQCDSLTSFIKIYGDSRAEEMRDKCAKAADPGPMPCDCISKYQTTDGKQFWGTECHCQNYDDRGEADAWICRRSISDAIAALPVSSEKGQKDG